MDKIKEPKWTKVRKSNKVIWVTPETRSALREKYPYLKSDEIRIRVAIGLQQDPMKAAE